MERKICLNQQTSQTKLCFGAINIYFCQDKVVNALDNNYWQTKTKQLKKYR